MDDQTKQGFSERWAAVEERMRDLLRDQEEAARRACEAFAEAHAQFMQSARALGIKE